MSRYFSQLARQTGVKIAGAVAPQECLPTPAAPSATPTAEGLEIEESSFGPSMGAAIAQPSAPIGSVPRSLTYTPSETEAKTDPHAVELGEARVSFEASAAGKPASAPSAIIQEVMNWIAEPAVAETRAPNGQVNSAPPSVRIAATAPPNESNVQDDRPIIHSGSPSSAVLLYQTIDQPHPGSLPAPKSGDEAWSVHIGSIHVEIEAPREKPSPRAVAPQPASPTVSGSRGSRLRRYYLRPC